MDELDRIEPAIDPYADPDLKEQWMLCIGNIMRRQQKLQSAGNGNQSSLNNTKDNENAAQMSAGKLQR